jgi:predicted amidohydrolase
MKVTLLQTDIQWGQPQQNMERARLLMDTQPGSDLYVLPEMWATGFATSPSDVPLIDETDSSTRAEACTPLQWMQRMAAERRCAVCGSLAVKTADGLYRNRHYFATADSLTYYDKHHLFTYGHEDRYYTPGNRHVVVQYQGVRLLLLTCYDLRFPVWSRYGRAGEYDLIVVVANWPHSRQQQWRILTRARAIENQCYLIGVNRVGDDGYCHYIGESVVCNQRGDTLLQCDTAAETAATVDLSLELLAEARTRFRVLDDRDE